MKNRVQQEIDKTLACLEDGLDIPVNPLFSEGLTQRMTRMQVKQVSGYQRRLSYPAVIVILLVLNLGACWIGFRSQASSSEAVQDAGDGGDVSSVLANEYGMNNLMGF